jgi:hypothetical protein
MTTYDSNNYSNAISNVNRYMTQRSFNELSNALSNTDTVHTLPRIFMCSVIFINERLAMTTCYNLDAIKDHKFTIIKHSNDDDYQIIQGYRDHHDLKGWNIINNNSKLDMKTFLRLLQEFGTNRTFNSSDYNKMFGVMHLKDNESAYWGSFSVEELEDDDIKGSGGREIADQIEVMIDNIKK